MATPLSSTRETFRTLVGDVAARATARLPEGVNGRVASAARLVLLHDVTPQDDGSILVGSTCECQDFQRGQAPQGWCQHRVAAGIDKRVRELLAAQEPRSPVEATGDTSDEPDPTTALPAAFPAMPDLSETLRKGRCSIHGKPCIRHSAFLAEAHARGLTRLETCFVSVTSELALASCTVTFANGLVVTDVADATPTNVSALVQPHWPRMAATRASARALRHALALDLCSLTSSAPSRRRIPSYGLACPRGEPLLYSFLPLGPGSKPPYQG